MANRPINEAQPTNSIPDRGLKSSARPSEQPSEINREATLPTSSEPPKLKSFAQEPGNQTVEQTAQPLNATIGTQIIVQSAEDASIRVKDTAQTTVTELVDQTVEPTSIPLLLEPLLPDHPDHGREYKDPESEYLKVENSGETSEIEEFVKALQEFNSMDRSVLPEVEMTGNLPFSLGGLNSRESQGNSCDGADEHKNLTELRTALRVAQRLTELEAEAKTEVRPMLEIILETLHDIELLQMEETNPQILETTRAKLEEQLIAVFEYLHIDYDAADLERLVDNLRLPDSQLPQFKAAETQKDLDEEGTHETKSNLIWPINNFTDIRQQLHQLLGKLVLGYSI